MRGRPWDITDLIERWDAGDRAALDQIFDELFYDLRVVARGIFIQRAGRPGHTLQPTALVNEAFIRIEQANRGRIPNSAAFRAYVARTMARILAEHYRRKSSPKHGGLMIRVPLEAANQAAGEAPEINAVQAFDLLERLSKLDPRAARVQYLRIYLGMTITEIAGLLGVSESTVKRNLKTAIAWMRAELSAAK